MYSILYIRRLKWILTFKAKRFSLITRSVENDVFRLKLFPIADLIDVICLQPF